MLGCEGGLEREWNGGKIESQGVMASHFDAPHILREKQEHSTFLSGNLEGSQNGGGGDKCG